MPTGSIGDCTRRWHVYLFTRYDWESTLCTHRLSTTFFWLSAMRERGYIYEEGSPHLYGSKYFPFPKDDVME
jgi:hypothetical protein